jgi:ribosomal protein L37AE/L43A
VSTSTTVTGTTDDDDACPYCGETTGVQRTTGTSLKVQAWSCRLCRTEWAVSLVNPHPRTAYLVDLVAAVAEIDWLRWTLRQVVGLAEQAPGLTDRELRARLLALASGAR